ncbi:uncharacterized protein LOC142363609 [Opisthocomus hoazin]|uniref:uncharacterized protein LOC142363609 n=1 Tax=Opisthocomus hoazin TaxID=30419 RepID=UPI003F539CF1
MVMGDVNNGQSWRFPPLTCSGEPHAAKQHPLHGHATASQVSLGWMETLCPSLTAPFVSPSPWSRAADARDPQSLSRQQKLSSCLISCCLISLRDGQVIDGEFDHFSEELGTINIHSRCVRAVLHRQVVPDPARRAPGHRLRPPTACAGRTPRPPGSHRAALAQQGGGALATGFAPMELGLSEKRKAEGSRKSTRVGSQGHGQVSSDLVAEVVQIGNPGLSHSCVNLQALCFQIKLPQQH